MFKLLFFLTLIALIIVSIVAIYAVRIAKSFVDGIRKMF